MLSPIPQLLLCQLSKPTSPASVTCKGSWCSSSACPCKDHSSRAGSQNSTDGVLDTKLQGPVSSSSCSLLLHSLLNTPFFCPPWLWWIKLWMSHRARTATPQLVFSSPSPFFSESTEGRLPWQRSWNISDLPSAACTHRSLRKQCQGQPVALAPQVPGHQHTHTGKRKLLSGPSNTNQLCLGRAATAHPCWGLSSSCAPETFCFSLWSRSNE